MVTFLRMEKKWPFQSKAKTWPPMFGDQVRSRLESPGLCLFVADFVCVSLSLFVVCCCLDGNVSCWILHWVIVEKDFEELVGYDSNLMFYKIRILRDETNQLVLKRNPWDTIGVGMILFRFQQKRFFQFGHLRRENSDERCLGTSSRGLWHPHRAFWTFCQLRHRENQVGGKRRKEVLYRIHPWKL